MKSLKLLILLVAAAFLFSCNSSDQHEFFSWSRELALHSTVEEVQATQPKGVTIDWEHPEVDTSLGIHRYYVTEIEGHRDILKMVYFLEFNEQGFVSRFAHK